MDERHLERLCAGVLSADPAIVEIVQFGSSVYAPEYAHDIDVLVLTKSKRDYDEYLDSLDELNMPLTQMW